MKSQFQINKTGLLRFLLTYKLLNSGEMTIFAIFWVMFLNLVFCIEPKIKTDFLSITVPIFSCPENMLVRKEFRDLTKSEWDAFKDALISLYTTPKEGTDITELDYWTGIHWKNVPEAHKYSSA